MFGHDTFCDLAGAEINRLADAIRRVDPALPVPTCGTWTVTDLARHTGVVHRWAGGLVTDLVQRYRGASGYYDWDPDATPAAHAEWLAAADKLLLAPLRDTDPDLPMWAWGADQHVRFWSRRMTHETGVHRADAELALGITPEFAPAVAVDGVSEFLANLPGARRWQPTIDLLRGDGETIRLSAVDSPDEWTITRRPGFPEWSRHEPAEGPPADVTVRAGAVDLYLMMWGRYACTDPRFDVTGDRELLEHWQRNSAV
ncbi:MAG TPA: maleylpyruvate isomerase family mycothiol-dependent enzyme [Micromonosporaceae bacterium]|nr:maleylpyruvate isomerase family mycothiol-dependent enzyme [Micromonosporaceae bacterium]